MAKRILIVRHAQTVANATDVIQGQTDGPLTELGERQAEALGRALANESIDVAYSSDLGRVKRTLECISKARKGPLKTVFARELRERTYGELENEPMSSLPAKRKIFEALNDAKPDGGESIDDLATRVVPFFEKVAASPEETVLLVTHHNPLIIILCHAAGLPLSEWRAFKSGNASVSELVFDFGRWRIRRSNDTCHWER